MNENSELITKVGKILSKQKNPDRHTLVSIFRPDSLEAKEHGVIYIVMEILSSDPTMGRIAKLIEKILIDKYYESLDDGLTSFEIALKAINEKLSELADDGEIGWIGKINSVIAILEGDILHITQTGTTESYMVRDSKMIHVTENLSSPAEKPNPLKTFINIVSGDMKIGDKIIISTSELFYHFSLDDIRRICMKFPPAVAASYIVKMLRREEIESINTLILEIAENESESNKFEDIGKKILSTSEQKIVEGYKNIVPFWKKFIKTSRKGIDVSLEKTKEIYGDKIAPSVSKFTQEAHKRVNERVQEITEKEGKKIPEGKKTKAERNLLNLVPEFKKAGVGQKDLASKKGSKPQQDLFESVPKKSSFFVVFGSIKSVARKAKSKSPIFMIAGILLIVLLVVSGFISYQKRTTQANRVKIETAYNALKTKVDSAIKANELGDSKKAQSLLNEAKEDAKNFPSSSYMKTDVINLEKIIDESMELIFNIKRFENISPITDLKQLDPTIKLTNIFRIGNLVYVIDKERHKSAVYNIETKQTSYLDNLSFDGTSQKIALLSDKNSIALLANEPDGIFIYNSKINSTEKASQITNDAWPKAKAISSYMNNLYLLVPSDNQIYKYSSLVGNYSNKNNYIVNAGGIKLDNAIDIAIDGSIYILMTNGEVARFTSGEKESFALTGMPSNANEKEKDSKAMMISAIRIITNADMKNIYIADSGAKRVVVFDKEGKYITQYISSKWNDMKDIWLSDGKLYILAGTEVYEIDAK